MNNILETHLDTLLEEFEIECDSNLNLYATSLQLYIEHSDLFSETMRNMIVEYAILKLFGKKKYRFMLFYFGSKNFD